MALPITALADAPEDSANATDVAVNRFEPIEVTRVMLGDEGAVVGMSDVNFVKRAGARLRELGVSVPEQSHLFEAATVIEARYQMGGTVLSNECVVRTRTFTRWCELTVRWEVFDPRSGAVIYKATTRGQGDAPIGFHRQYIETALDLSIDQLVALPQFFATLEVREDDEEAPSWMGGYELKTCTDQVTELPDGLNEVLDRSAVIKTANSVGMGVIVSPDGFLMTAAHVVGDASTVKVMQHSGVALDAEVLRVDHAVDVALLRLPGTGYPCLAAATEAPPLGANLYAIGSPADELLQFSVSRGVVSGNRVVDDITLLQTDASISPGYSGGPMVSDTGELHGLISFKLVSDTIEGVAFGVDIRSAASALEIHWTDQTGADGIGRRGEGHLASSLPPRQMFVDDDAPSRLTRYDEENRIVRVRRAYHGVALTTSVAGWIVVAATAGRYADPTFTASTETWRTMQVGNTIGWTMGLGGLVAPLFAPTLPPKNAP